jgi:bifunctional DNA-binding transcriptional regulator/antitoxin component of YhaV-PrlF toxin-antitoxin module
MTVVHMSEKGQVVVPKEIRDEKGYGNGTAFLVVQSKSGALVFRAVNSRPKLSLIEHLRKFKGIEIPEIKALCPPRI